MSKSIKEAGLYQLGNLHPAIVKLKEGRVADVIERELTHPRIVHLYTQQRILYDKLGEKWYNELIGDAHKTSPTDLEISLRDIEGKYTEILVDRGYNPLSAREEAHLLTKAYRKVWYRMRTDFDKIDELHNRRVAHIQELGNYLLEAPPIKGATDLMLMIKDLAGGTDGDDSDMDLAFSLRVKDNPTARAVAINAIKPVIRDFELARSPPPRTAHIDWEDQIYATPWLLSIAGQPPSQEIIYDGYRTNTQSRRFLAENVFGFQEGHSSPLAIPVYPISNKELFEELMVRFTDPPTRPSEFAVVSPVSNSTRTNGKVARVII